MVYHSAFGFARVVGVQGDEAELSWEKPDDNLPSRVPLLTIQRVYGLCAADGFFDRALRDPDSLTELIHFDPLQALHLLLVDLGAPQRTNDIREWLVGRVMSEEAYRHWWQALAPQLGADPRFQVEGERIALIASSTDEGALMALRDPALAPRRRLDLALQHRGRLGETRFSEQVILAWRTGPAAVRDQAMAALRGVPADQLVQRLLIDGPESIDAVVHAMRRAGWKAEDLSTETYALLLDRLATAARRGGSLEAEGRLAAALQRWIPNELASMLCRLAEREPGQQLVRATCAALHATRSPEWLVELLLHAIGGDYSRAATHWLASELLEARRQGPEEVAKGLESTHPQLARWFREAYDPFYGDDWDDDDEFGTAELDVDWLSKPVAINDLSRRSGANALSVGLAVARAIAEAHKTLVVVNPSREVLSFQPDGSVKWTGTGAPESSPRLPNEPPSLRGDVYAGAVVVIESLIGREWPRRLPAGLVLPYLRHVSPALPPSALAPLSAALHAHPGHRPANASEWLVLWERAIEAEERRTQASLDPAARLRLGYDSHIGRVKLLSTQTNQDALLLQSRDGVDLIVVCDGISTATAGSGDIASSIAAHVIAGMWEQSLPRLREADIDETWAFLDRALRTANRAVCEAATRLAGGSLEGKIPMGTTVVTAVVRGNRAALAWLGDSRAYLVGPYGPAQLTADQNQAGERFTAWVGEQERNWDPNGFALVGYLGHFDGLGQPDALPPSHAAFTLLPGERLLLCTDGVTDYIGEQPPDVAALIADCLTEEHIDDAACELIRAANRGGGGDNITAVVAELA